MTTFDFEKLKEFSELWETPYLDNTNMLDSHIVVLAIGLLSVAALVGNLIWKLVLMHNEKKLIAAGKEAAV